MKQFFASLVVLFVFAPMVRVNGSQPLPEMILATVIIKSSTGPITPRKIRCAWDSPVNYRQAPARFRAGCATRAFAGEPAESIPLRPLI